MFTGIVQATAQIAALRDGAGLRSLEIEFPAGFCQGLEIGASVAIDGVCLTVSARPTPDRAVFDVMLHSLNVTTLGDYAQGRRVNAERAARDGAEIGGHVLSGHIDCCATLVDVCALQDNLVWRLSVPPGFGKYLFARGYVALHGASLTLAAVERSAHWFEVWLIPETRRATVFEQLRVGDRLNLEIERSTQVLVDTVRDALHEGLGRMQPLFDALLQEKGLTPEDLIQPPPLLPPRH